MFYSPHNEYINDQAKLIIVGITPGWNQMRVAFEHVIHCLYQELPFTLDQLLKETKKAASFSGTMRINLVDMLNQVGIPQVLQIKTSASLFEEHRDLIHTTSVIKYPVFYQNKNYTGHKPKIYQSPLLSRYAYEIFVEELNQITNKTLIIPLGKMVEVVLQHIIEKGELKKHVFLFGFPHPSGANGHRLKQFNQHKTLFCSSIQKWKRNV